MSIALAFGEGDAIVCYNLPTISTTQEFQAPTSGSARCLPMETVRN